MNFLVIGASSVAGRNAVKAIRKFNADAKIIGTTSGDAALDMVDETITGIDLSNKYAAGKIAYEAVKHAPIYGLVYTPAFGRVGIPMDRATKEDVSDSLDFSFRPMLSLIQKLNPEINVAFSGFYWLDSLLRAYGAMAMTKIAMEETAIANPNKLKIVRSGLFSSKSLRGILLLIQRTLTKDLYEELRPIRDSWKESGKKFPAYFYDFAYGCEVDMYEQQFDTPHRATSENDIVDAVLHVLQGEEAPIYNVMGDWRWSEDKLPELPPVLVKCKQLIPEGLNSYFKEPALI